MARHIPRSSKIFLPGEIRGHRGASGVKLQHEDTMKNMTLLCYLLIATSYAALCLLHYLDR